MIDRTLTLTHPIDGLRADETIKTLTFNLPRARLFRQYGNPHKVVNIQNKNNPDEARVEFVTDENAYIGFIAEMTGLDRMQVDELVAADYEQAKVIVWMMINTAVKSDDGRPTM